MGIFSKKTQAAAVAVSAPVEFEMSICANSVDNFKKLQDAGTLLAKHLYLRGPEAALVKIPAHLSFDEDVVTVSLTPVVSLVGKYPYLVIKDCTFSADLSGGLRFEVEEIEFLLRNVRNEKT